MGIYDSMNQPATPQGQVANGSSFAQKQQMKANPMMRGRPAMGAPMGTPPVGMRPNPMTGARPALGASTSMGMGGPKPKPTMGNVPLQPSKGLAPSHTIANPSAGVPTLKAPGDMQLYGSTPETPGNDQILNAYQGNPQDGSQATIFGGRELQAPPFQGGGNPSFQSMMEGAQFSRPDVMPRGLGPSAPPVVMDENGLEPRRAAR